MANFKSLGIGEALSETQYYKVVKIVGDKAQLVNDHGENIVVDKGYVEKCLTSASEATSVTKVSKTEMAELFIKNSGVVMTVNFNKQVQQEAVVKEVMETLGSAKISEIEKAVKAGIKKAINGEERTLTGFHYANQDDFGRTKMVDMNITKDASKDYDTRLRLVDSRTINWAIIRGIKYEVKSK